MTALRQVLVGGGAAALVVLACGGEIRLSSSSRVGDDAGGDGGLRPDADGAPPLCQGDEDCPDDLRCDGPRGACVACLVDAHCSSGDRSFCDRARGVCLECRADTDCDADEPFCSAAGECVACRSSSDCPPDKPVCEAESSECSSR